jgi:ribosomal protein L19E
MAMTNAERQRKYKGKVEATGLTRLQVWVTPEQAQAIKRFMTGEDRLAVKDNVTSDVSGNDKSTLVSLKAVMERWEEQLKDRHDSSGQVKQPCWAKCFELWQELAQALKQSEQS